MIINAKQTRDILLYHIELKPLPYQASLPLYESPCHESRHIYLSQNTNRNYGLSLLGISITVGIVEV